MLNLYMLDLARSGKDGGLAAHVGAAPNAMAQEAPDRTQAVTPMAPNGAPGLLAQPAR